MTDTCTARPGHTDSRMSNNHGPWRAAQADTAEGSAPC